MHGVVCGAKGHHVAGPTVHFDHAIYHDCLSIESQYRFICWISVKRSGTKKGKTRTTETKWIRSQDVLIIYTSVQNAVGKGLKQIDDDINGQFREPEMDSVLSQKTKDPHLCFLGSSKI